MFLFAMSPAAPLLAKVFVGLLMLGLAGLLLGGARKDAFRGWSWLLAAASTIALIALLERKLPVSILEALNSLAILAALAGAVSAVVFLRPKMVSSERRSRKEILCIAIAALLSGPLLGLILAIVVLAFDDAVVPDTGYTLAVFVGLGTIAGLIGSPIIALVMSKSTAAPSEESQSGHDDPSSSATA